MKEGLNWTMPSLDQCPTTLKGRRDMYRALHILYYKCKLSILIPVRFQILGRQTRLIQMMMMIESDLLADSRQNQTSVVEDDFEGQAVWAFYSRTAREQPKG